MISEKQLEANRRNAQRSTGPTTEAGKQRSKLNASRHHLTGQVTTMTEPDRTAFNSFLDRIMNDLKPEGAMEVQLAQRIAHDHWRLNRAAAIEDNLYAMGVGHLGGNECNTHPEIDDAMTHARVYTREAKNLQLLTLYEQRINRTLQKNMALLKSMQEERRARRAAEMEEASRLLQLSEMRGREYKPEQDGFVFSKEQIYTAIDRSSRLQRAARTDFNRFQHRKFRQQATIGTVSAASPHAA
jgi:hypothetical protein